MRIATLQAVLFFLATSSTAFAATRAIKFVKLVDGLGRVFTNAVVTSKTTGCEASQVAARRYQI